MMILPVPLLVTVLLSISDSNVKRYQYLSSVAVYPKNAKNPLIESTTLHFNDLFGYADAKILGEKQCKLFADELGLKISVIRADNSFGPRDNFSSSSRVIPSLITKAFDSNMLGSDGVFWLGGFFSYLVSELLSQTGSGAFVVSELFLFLLSNWFFAEEPNFKPVKPG